MRQIGDRVQWPQPEIPLGGTVRGVEGERLDILWDDGTRAILTESELADSRGKEEPQSPQPKAATRRPRRPRAAPQA